MNAGYVILAVFGILAFKAMTADSATASIYSIDYIPADEPLLEEE